MSSLYTDPRRWILDREARRVLAEFGYSLDGRTFPDIQEWSRTVDTVWKRNMERESQTIACGYSADVVMRYIRASMTSGGMDADRVDSETFELQASYVVELIYSLYIWAQAGQREFLVDPDLCEELLESEIAKDIPLSHVRPPFEGICIRLGKFICDETDRHVKDVFVCDATNSDHAVILPVMDRGLKLFPVLWRGRDFAGHTVAEYLDAEFEDVKERGKRVSLKDLPILRVFELIYKIILFINSRESSSYRDTRRIAELENKVMYSRRAGQKIHLERLLEAERNRYIYLLPKRREIQNDSGSPIERSAMACHRRRGHFWSAPCGPRRARRELRWRRPCWVNPGVAETVLSEYVVEKKGGEA